MMRKGQVTCVALLLGCCTLLATASRVPLAAPAVAQSTATGGTVQESVARRLDQTEAQAKAIAQATGTNAKASSSASATTGGTTTQPGAQSSASASASADAGTKTDAKPVVYDAEAGKAFFAFVSKCTNDVYDPKKTTPGECAGLSGALCSREKVVKCGADKTDFIDASGAVIATGDHKTKKICYTAGDKKGTCREGPAVPKTDAKPVVYDAEAEKAFFAYASKCEGGRFESTKTPASVCGGLSGDLCSKEKVVKCSEGKTDFLDAATGAVYANGDNKIPNICYIAGDKKGTCRAS